MECCVFRYLPGMRYCMLTASSFSRSRRRQMAAHENKIDAINEKPTPIQAIMYDLNNNNKTWRLIAMKKRGILNKIINSPIVIDAWGILENLSKTKIRIKYLEIWNKSTSVCLSKSHKVQDLSRMLIYYRQIMAIFYLMERKKKRPNHSNNKEKKQLEGVN